MLWCHGRGCFFFVSFAFFVFVFQFVEDFRFSMLVCVCVFVCVCVCVLLLSVFFFECVYVSVSFVCVVLWEANRFFLLCVLALVVGLVRGGLFCRLPPPVWCALPVGRARQHGVTIIIKRGLCVGGSCCVAASGQTQTLVFVALSFCLPLSFSLSLFP